MATEAKMGMFIVVILVCAFAFLVYHKFDLRQRELLAAEMKAGNGESNTDPGEEDDVVERFDNVGPEDISSANIAQSDPEFGKEEALQPVFDRLADQQGDITLAASSAGADSRVAAFEGLSEPAPSEPSEPDFDALMATADMDATKSQEFDGLTSTEQFPEDSSTDTVNTNNADVFAAFDEPAVDVAAQLSVQEPTFSSEVKALNAVDSTFDANQSVPTPAPVNETPFAAEAFDELPFDDFSTESVASSTVSPTPEFSDRLPTERTRSGEDTQPPAFEPRDLPPEFETTNAAVVDSDIGTEFAASDTLIAVADSNALPPVDEPRSFSPTQPDYESDDVVSPPAFDPLSVGAFDEGAFTDNEPQLAMLDPAPDVNLFEEPVSSSPKPPAPVVKEQEAFFPAAEEPEMPSFGSDFGATEVEPRVERFQPTESQSEALQPPTDSPDFFSEPVVTSKPTQTKVVPAPRDVNPSPFQPRQPPQSTLTARPAPYENSTFATPRNTRPLQIWEPDSASRVQQTSAQDVSDECDICEVRDKDTYWTISKRMYGTARYFSSLALYNQHRIRDPKKLREGMKVLCPDPKTLESRYPEFFRGLKPRAKKPTGFFLTETGRPAYRVGERETLSEISQKHLGRASRWMQIYQLNRKTLTEPDKLKPGIVLQLPEDATNVRIKP